MQSQTHVEQVGGSHYQAQYQHWDLIDDCNVSYLEATATKYLDRWEKKNGIQDLQKAITYLQKRISCMSVFDHHSTMRQFTMRGVKMLNWFNSTNMPAAERDICTVIFFWEEKEDLEQAVKMIQKLITQKELSSRQGVDRISKEADCV